MNKEDYFKYYIQGSDHYLIPKDVFIELFDEMSNWREEVKELKKHLDTSNELVAQSVQTEMKLRDENNRLRKKYQDTYKDVRIEIKEYKTQQKEFINYLGNEIKLYENDIQNFKKDYKVYFSLINDLRVSKAKIEEILQKYRSIIGDDR